MDSGDPKVGFPKTTFILKGHGDEPVFMFIVMQQISFDSVFRKEEKFRLHLWLASSMALQIQMSFFRCFYFSVGVAVIA